MPGNSLWELPEQISCLRTIIQEKIGVNILGGRDVSINRSCNEINEIPHQDIPEIGVVR